jgi:hypothetical protein
MLIIVRCVREEGERAGSVCVSMLDTADPWLLVSPTLPAVGIIQWDEMCDGSLQTSQGRVEMVKEPVR